MIFFLYSITMLNCSFHINAKQHQFDILLAGFPHAAVSCHRFRSASRHNSLYNRSNIQAPISNLIKSRSIVIGHVLVGLISGILPNSITDLAVRSIPVCIFLLAINTCFFFVKFSILSNYFKMSNEIQQLI